MSSSGVAPDIAASAFVLKSREPLACCCFAAIVSRTNSTMHLPRSDSGERARMRAQRPHQYIALNGTSRMRFAELPCHSERTPPRCIYRAQVTHADDASQCGGYLSRHTLHQAQRLRRGRGANASGKQGADVVMQRDGCLCK